MDITRDKEEIQDRIGKKRMAHVLRVADYAKDLAVQYGQDPEKAYIAGFYHDCMKIKDLDLLKKAARDLGLEWTEEFNQAPQLVHGFLGALAAEKIYGIQDRDILNAIAYHTTGRAGMNDLEKIIYLADYAEPMRNFDGVDQARKEIKEDLDQAMYQALNRTIQYLIKENSYITLKSLEARNDFLKKVNHGKIY